MSRPEPPIPNPVVAVLPVKGWYAVFALWDTLPEGANRQPFALPIEHATIHADGSRKLWISDGDGVQVAGHLGNFGYLGTVQATPGADAVFLRPQFDRPIYVRRDGVSLAWTLGDHR